MNLTPRQSEITAEAERDALQRLYREIKAETRRAEAALDAYKADAERWQWWRLRMNSDETAAGRELRGIALDHWTDARPAARAKEQG